MYAIVLPLSHGVPRAEATMQQRVISLVCSQMWMNGDCCRATSSTGEMNTQPWRGMKAGIGNTLASLVLLCPSTVFCLLFYVNKKDYAWKSLSLRKKQGCLYCHFLSPFFEHYYQTLSTVLSFGCLHHHVNVTGEINVHSYTPFMIMEKPWSACHVPPSWAQ